VSRCLAWAITAATAPQMSATMRYHMSVRMTRRRVLIHSGLPAGASRGWLATCGPAGARVHGGGYRARCGCHAAGAWWMGDGMQWTLPVTAGHPQAAGAWWVGGKKIRQIRARAAVTVPPGWRCSC
jgi:hypothetical protein